MGRRIVKSSQGSGSGGQGQKLIKGIFLLFFFYTLYPISYALFLTGCAPTYLKDSVEEAVVKLCNREYHIAVDTKIIGNTIAVYLPAENLFDAVLNIDQRASKKINDVILGVSRVTLSADAKFDFYVVIAQDPKALEVEIVYIRYVNDMKRFLLGDISRDEYSRRAVIMLKTPPQAERERILKELFAKLDIENPGEMLKEYMKNEQRVVGIGEISYWNKNFFLKEIDLSEFLASQIDERLKSEFRQNRDLNKWYEVKASDARFIKREGGGIFIFNIDVTNRVTPLYLDSGVELEAQRKKTLVFEKLTGVIANVLHLYKFEDFDKVGIFVLNEKKIITKDKLWKFRTSKRKAEGSLLDAANLMY